MRGQKKNSFENRTPSFISYLFSLCPVTLCYFCFFLGGLCVFAALGEHLVPEALTLFGRISFVRLRRSVYAGFPHIHSAANDPARKRPCIVPWMAGGRRRPIPSTRSLDHDNGRAVQDHMLPRRGRRASPNTCRLLAKQMKHLASCAVDGDQRRRSRPRHASPADRQPAEGQCDFPTFGPLVSKEREA